MAAQSTQPQTILVGQSTGQSGLQFTQGWYIFAGCVAAIALSQTKAAPIVLGILGVACIYQLGKLIQERGAASDPAKIFTMGGTAPGA